jgi:hypothetical protein
MTHYYTEQNYIEQIKANLAWNYIDTNITIIVWEIVDTGKDYLHEDLKDNIYYNEVKWDYDEHGIRLNVIMELMMTEWIC